MKDSTELSQAVLLGTPPLFHPNTGQDLRQIEGPDGRVQVKLHHAAAAGLDVPRYCQLCGRRMVVQVRPDGWLAVCSRHGQLDSSLLDR